MGNKQCDKEHIVKDDWEIIKFGLNQNEFLRNRKDHQMCIEEYYLASYEKQKLEAIRNLYYLRKNHLRWVASYFLVQDQSHQYCASRFSVKLYLERMHRRLTEIGNIPFPDSLHLFNQALHGYWEFARRFGCFEVQRQYMGINDRGVLKTWAGPDWTQVSVIGGKVSQQKMVRSIIQAIQMSVERSTFPAAYPTFKNYMYRANGDVDFKQAVGQLQNYATMTNGGVISPSLNCLKLFPSQAVQNHKITSANHGRQFLSSNISNPTYRIASSRHNENTQKAQMFSSTALSVPVQPQKINIISVQSNRNQHIRKAPIPHIKFVNRVGTNKQPPVRQKQNVETVSHQSKIDRAIKFSGNQRHRQMKMPLPVTPSSATKSQRLLNQKVSRSIVVPQSSPMLTKGYSRGSKQQLASNKQSKNDSPEYKSIIMQLYQSHDNVKFNAIPVQETKSFADVKKSESVKDEDQKHLDPIFEGSITELQQSPKKSKENYYDDQNKLKFSYQTKGTFEFNKNKSSYAELSQDDGKSSEDFLKKIKSFGKGSTFLHQFQSTTDYRFNLTKFPSHIPIELKRQNESRKGSAFSPLTLTPKKSDLQHPLDNKLPQNPYSTNRYDSKRQE